MKARILLLSMFVLGFAFNSEAQVRRVPVKQQKVAVVNPHKSANKKAIKVNKKSTKVGYVLPPTKSKMVKIQPVKRKDFHFKAR